MWDLFQGYRNRNKSVESVQPINQYTNYYINGDSIITSRSDAQYGGYIKLTLQGNSSPHKIDSISYRIPPDTWHTVVGIEANGFNALTDFPGLYFNKQTGQYKFIVTESDSREISVTYYNGVLEYFQQKSNVTDEFMEQLCKDIFMLKYALDNGHREITEFANGRNTGHVAFFGNYELLASALEQTSQGIPYNSQAQSQSQSFSLSRQPSASESAPLFNYNPTRPFFAPGQETTRGGWPLAHSIVHASKDRNSIFLHATRKGLRTGGFVLEPGQGNNPLAASCLINPDHPLPEPHEILRAFIVDEANRTLMINNSLWGGSTAEYNHMINFFSNLLSDSNAEGEFESYKYVSDAIHDFFDMGRGASPATLDLKIKVLKGYFSNSSLAEELFYNIEPNKLKDAVEYFAKFFVMWFCTYFDSRHFVAGTTKVWSGNSIQEQIDGISKAFQPHSVFFVTDVVNCNYQLAVTTALSIRANQNQPPTAYRKTEENEAMSKAEQRKKKGIARVKQIARRVLHNEGAQVAFADMGKGRRNATEISKKAIRRLINQREEQLKQAVKQQAGGMPVTKAIFGKALGEIQQQAKRRKAKAKFNPGSRRDQQRREKKRDQRRGKR